MALLVDILHRAQRCLIVVVGFATSLSAQDQPATGNTGFRIGASIAGLYTYQAGAMDHLGFTFHLPERPTIEDPSGTGLGFATGIVAHYKLNSCFGLRSHLQYSSHSASWYTPLPGIQLLNPINSEIDRLYMEALAESKRTSFGADLLGTALLARIGPGQLMVAAGPALEHIVTLTESRRVQPHNGRSFTLSMPGFPDSIYSFPDTVYSMNKPVEDVASVRFSVRGGVFYDIALPNNLSVSPGVYFDHGLIPMIKDSDWSLNFLMLNIAVMMRL